MKFNVNQKNYFKRVFLFTAFSFLAIIFISSPSLVLGQTKADLDALSDAERLARRLDQQLENIIQQEQQHLLDGGQLEDLANKLADDVNEYISQVLSKQHNDLSKMQRQLAQDSPAPQASLQNEITQLTDKIRKYARHPSLNTALRILAKYKLFAQAEMIFKLSIMSHCYGGHCALSNTCEACINRETKEYRQYLADLKTAAPTNEVLKIKPLSLGQCRCYSTQALSSHQQMLIELMEASTRNIYGHQTQPIRANALKQEMDQMIKKTFLERSQDQ